jgi:hypothetical protein
VIALIEIVQLIPILFVDFHTMVAKTMQNLRDCRIFIQFGPTLVFLREIQKPRSILHERHVDGTSRSLLLPRYLEPRFPLPKMISFGPGVISSLGIASSSFSRSKTLSMGCRFIG